MMRRQVKGPFGYWNFPLINSISQPSMRRQELGTMIYGEMAETFDLIDDLERYIEIEEQAVRNGDIASALTTLKKISELSLKLDEKLRTAYGRGHE